MGPDVCGLPQNDTQKSFFQKKRKKKESIDRRNSKNKKVNPDSKHVIHGEWLLEQCNLKVSKGREEEAEVQSTLDTVRRFEVDI